MHETIFVVSYLVPLFFKSLPGAVSHHREGYPQNPEIPKFQYTLSAVLLSGSFCWVLLL